MDVSLVILPRETSGGGVHFPAAVIFFLVFYLISGIIIQVPVSVAILLMHVFFPSSPLQPTLVPRTHMLALLCCRPFFGTRRCYVRSYFILQRYSQEMLVSATLCCSNPQETQNNIQNFHFVCHDVQS
jgi:hypothetical protein